MKQKWAKISILTSDCGKYCDKKWKGFGELESGIGPGINGCVLFTHLPVLWPDGKGNYPRCAACLAGDE